MLGKYEAYYPTTLLPAACYEPVRVGAGDSTLRRLLSGAASNGVQVHITPAMPHSPFAWPHQPVDKYFGALAELQATAFADIWKAYPEFRSTITGVYTALEEWNGIGWMQYNQSLAEHYLQPFATRAKNISSSVQVWASPYYVGNLSLHRTARSPVEYAAFWQRVWQLAPAFDWIALQDSRGWQGNSDEEVAAALRELRTAAMASGRQLWSNIELFEGWPRPCTYPTPCGRHPAPIGRIIQQLASEDRFAAHHVAWEWSSCLSPFTNTDTAALYRDYMAYLSGGADAAARADTNAGKGGLALRVSNLTIPQVDYEPLLTPGFHGMPTLNLSAVNYSRIVNKTHAAIELESERLKVTLLPAMGRVYRIYNKETGHDVLWRNDIA